MEPTQGHHLILGELIDFITGETLQDTHDERYLQKLARLLVEQKEILQESDGSIEGFNVGMNCGEVAGQSVFHCHVHLIPRRRGDVEWPKGGVRHVIPYKGNY